MGKLIFFLFLLTSFNSINPASAQGRWVWWWKNHLDRKWIASLTV